MVLHLSQVLLFTFCNIFSKISFKIISANPNALFENYDYLFEPQGSDVQDMWDQLYYEEKEFENLKCEDEDKVTIDYDLKK